MTPTPSPRLPSSPAGSILRALAWIFLVCAAGAILTAATSAGDVERAGGGAQAIGTVFARLAFYALPLGLGATLAFACAHIADAIHCTARQAVLHTQLLSQIRDRQHPEPTAPAPAGPPIDAAELAAAIRSMRAATKA